MSLSTPCISGLLSRDRVAYSVAVREWKEYIEAMLQDADHRNLRLVSSDDMRVVWRHLNGDTVLEFCLLFGTIRRVTIEQTGWRVCECNNCGCESTACVTIADGGFYDWGGGDFYNFGLSAATPMHWQYLQVIWEDKRRCTRCLRRNADMCDCSMYRRRRDAE